jgi:hypothetical protein
MLDRRNFIEEKLDWRRERGRYTHSYLNTGYGPLFIEYHNGSSMNEKMTNAICRILSPEWFALSRQKNASLENVTTVWRQISWTFSSVTISIWIAATPGGLSERRRTTRSISNQWLFRSILFSLRSKRDGLHFYFTCTAIDNNNVTISRNSEPNQQKKRFIVAQVDFHMNYILLRQRKVQQGFFHHSSDHWKRTSKLSNHEWLHGAHDIVC